MLEVVLFSIAFVLLVIAAITDLRTREVPDWVNFAGITAGLGIRLLWSLTTKDWSILGWGVVGFVAFFVIACLMFYTGQWGGGDSKLLMALGALFGFEFSLTHMSVMFFIWALIAGAVYGMGWSAVLAVKHWAVFVARFKTIARSVRWAYVPVLAVLVLGIAFAIASDDTLLRGLMFMIAVLVPVLFVATIGVKAVELSCMYKAVKPQQLTEGDWIAKPVTYRGKYVCGPKNLGITKETIQELKRLKIKQVIVKEGIPFTPSFLIAFLLALWVGNPLRWFV